MSRRICALVGFLVLATSVTAAAQEVSGRLQGRVSTSEGQPIAGVEVTATGASLLGRRTATTGKDGKFLIPALPAGTYDLAARRLGFRPVTVERVPVRLGETATLAAVTMTAAATQLAPVVVSAEAAGLDPHNTAQRIVLDASRLDALPLDRSFREAMLLAPSSVPSFIGKDGGGAGINRDGINVGGATGYENTYFLDGINITSPIRGETSMDLPYNFIQQMEVRTGGSTADDAQSLGGVVNLVTPTGAERFGGQVFGFFSNDALEGRSRPVSGSYQTGFTFYDAGVSIGGPLLKDRLRMFAAYNANHEARDYSYGFGSLTSTRRQHLFAGKLTWQASERTSGFLTVLGDPGTSDPLAMPLFGSGIPQNAEVLQRSDRTGGVGVSLSAHHLFPAGILLEASLSQMTRLDRGEPKTSGGFAPIVIDHLQGTLSGGHGFGYRFDSRRRTARVDASGRAGTHTLKGGVQLEQLHGDISIDIARGSAGGTIERIDTSLYTWHSASGANGPGTNNNPAVYLQDTWELTPRISIRAGARWSRQALRAGTPGVIYRRYDVRDGIQPRVGLSYQPGTLGTERLFATWSRATEQLPVWGFQDFAAGAESLFVYEVDPRVNPGAGELSYGVTYGAGTPSDARLRGQAVDSWGLGYERQFRAFSIALAARRRALIRVLANGTDTVGGPIWGNPGEGAMSHFPRITRTYNALEATVETRRSGRSWFRASYVFSRTHGNYPGLFASDWGLGVPNYGPMFILPEQYENATGLLPNDRPHLFKAFGARDVNGRLTLGASLLVASGTPLTEYGAISIAAPFRGIVGQRGIAGRTPAIWDLGLRTTWELPRPLATALRTRMLFDLQHVGSPRKPVEFEQWHYTCLEANSTQGCANAGYGRVLQYQSPMTARIGIVMDFDRQR